MRLIGLIGGTGGGTKEPAPFFNDASARLTVSTTDVVDRKTGSEISDLAIDFLRNIPCLMSGWTAPGLKAAAFGVVGFEAGGVWLAEKGATGEA